MQTVLSQKASFSGSTLRSADRSQRCNRTALVVRADAESRRAVVTGLMAGIAGLTLNSATFAKPAQAIAPEIRDDRKAKENGFDIIYEARDVDLPQNVREGFTQARASLDATKKRVAESERRIDAKLQPYIAKKYWTEAREELRLQLGTLRFDLETLAGQLPKPDKKKALALKKSFFSKADELDYAIRTKDQTAAEKALAITKSSLDAVLGAVA